MKYMIVNADDYGRTPTVSAGIRKAHLEGILTSTTAMMNMPEVEADLHTALKECPDLGLGVHLTLTAEGPVLSPSHLPSLMRLSDGSHFPKLADLSKSVESLNAVEIKAEWRAQIEKFVRIAGRAPTHLDSHHHTSYFSPAWFGAMLELAREYRCGIRNPIASTAGMETVVSEMPSVQFLHPMLLASTDVLRPDRFEARFYDERATSAMLEEIIAGLPHAVTEIMSHPGLPDETLAAITGYNRQRAQELAVLTAPGLRERVRTAGVELISFAGLA